MDFTVAAMNMANIERRSTGGNGPAKDPDESTVSPVLPIIQHRKHWAKKYRTEIAASGSSVLSTFVAVGRIYALKFLDHYANTRYSWQYPLDSVKTRMQAYVHYFS